MIFICEISFRTGLQGIMCTCGIVEPGPVHAIRRHVGWTCAPSPSSSYSSWGFNGILCHIRTATPNAPIHEHIHIYTPAHHTHTRTYARRASGGAHVHTLTHTHARTHNAQHTHTHIYILYLFVCVYVRVRACVRACVTTAMAARSMVWV